MPNFADGIQYVNSSGIGSYVDTGVLISSGDLNTFYGANYWGKQFYAVDGNTLTNTPVTGQGFSLEILRAGDRTTVQRITNITSISEASVSVMWVRSTTLTGEEDTSPVSGTWTEWRQYATIDGTYPDMTVGNATNATNDGEGNNIASTYATKSALSSGLAGKANTSGTYPNMTVGNATNATNDGSGHPILSFLKNSLTIDDLSSDADLPTQFNFASFVASIASPKGACAAAYAMTAEYDAYYSSNITASTVNGYILKVMFTDITGVQLFAPPQSSITAKMIVTAIGDFPLSGTEFAFTALLIR